MQLKIDKDRTTVIIIFCLCGAIFLLMASILVSFFQTRGVFNERNEANQSIILLNEKCDLLESKLSVMTSYKDLVIISRDLATDDVATLRSFILDIFMPYGSGLEDLYFDYNSLAIDIFNDTRSSMSLYEYRNFSNRIDDLDEIWDELQDSADVGFDEILESGLMLE